MDITALERRTKKYEQNISNIKAILNKEEKKLEKHLIFTNIFKMYQEDENFTPFSSFESNQSCQSNQSYQPYQSNQSYQDYSYESDEDEISMLSDEDNDDEDNDDEDNDDEDNDYEDNDEIQSVELSNEFYENELISHVSENKSLIKKCISITPKIVEVAITTGCFC